MSENKKKFLLVNGSSKFIEVGTPLDIVDWTDNTLTINATGFVPLWPYTINGTSFALNQLNTDRTATITYNGQADSEILINVTNKNGKTFSNHKYKVPHIITENSILTGTNIDSVVFIKYGITLTITEDTMLNTIYIDPNAELIINNNVTLWVKNLILRTTSISSAILTNNGNLISDNVFYTRIVSDRNYHMLGLPFSSNISDVYLSNSASFPYQNTWLVKKYDEAKRAENGSNDERNWIELTSTEQIIAKYGYELYSGSAYYRELYFPVTIPNTIDKTVNVTYTEGAAGTEHSGWNEICSPLTSKFINTPENTETAIKIHLLQEDGTDKEVVPDVIYPAIPFFYKASANGKLDFSGSELKFIAD